MYVLIRKYVDVPINLKKPTYDLEEYSASMGMNNDGQTSVDGHLWMDGTE
jgi:hypothetical protein